MRREEILQTIKEHTDDLRERFDVESLAVFGSVAREESTATTELEPLERRIQAILK